MTVTGLPYAPAISGGLDKILRFFCLTSIGIIAPFVLFDSAAKLRNFLFAIAIGGLLLAVNSLTMLGGQDRLVSPRGLNTEIGAASAILLIIFWRLSFSEWSFFKRIVLYPVL